MIRLRTLSTLLISIVVLAAALALMTNKGQAQGSVFYVSLQGNDTTGNGSRTSPFATPDRALEEVVANRGDTIYFRFGTYSRTDNIRLLPETAGITISTDPIDLQNPQMGRATLTVTGASVLFIYKCPNTTISNLNLVRPNNDPVEKPVVSTDESHNLKLADLDIQGGYYGINLSPGEDDNGYLLTNGVTIQRCKIHDSDYDGIHSLNSDNIVIEDCEIFNTGIVGANAQGIDLVGSIGSGGSQGIIIRRCYVHDTRSTGIQIKGGSQNGLVERCRVVNSEGSGILLGQSSSEEFMRNGTQYEAIDCVARNNIIDGTDFAGIGSYAGNNVRFYNNTVYNAAQVNHAGVWLVENERDVFCRDVTIKNNIIVTTNAPRTRSMYFAKELQTPLVSDNNIYFNTNGSYSLCREVGQQETCYSSLSAWQTAMSTDQNSAVANPTLDSNNLYKPLAGSPAIDHGQTLTEVPKDYSEIVRPQGSAYDVGAHEVGGTGGGGGCLTVPFNGSIWRLTPFTSQTASFTAEVDVTPAGQNTDAAVGLKLGSQASWSSLACIVRFNDVGNIDARNGGSYQAALTMPYTANTAYHIRMVVSVAAHTYSVYITPAGGSETLLAQNYAFRTEQSAVTSLDTWAIVAEVGSETACGFALSAGDVTPPTVNMTAPANGSTVSATISVAATASDSGGVAGVQFLVDGNATGVEDTTSPYSIAFNTLTLANSSHTFSARARDNAGNMTTSTAMTVTVNNANCKTATAGTTQWVNTAFASKTGTFTFRLDATPLTASQDTLVALSKGSQTSWSGLACIVRFNSSNTIDVRNGGAYQAATTITYTPNTLYHIRMVVNVTNHTYSVYIMPQGGTEILLAQNYAFRTEQNAVTSLNNWVLEAEVGSIKACNYVLQ